MGYIASSHVYNGTGETGGTSISATLPVACAAGDVVLAMVSCSAGGSIWDVSSVTSSNISWSQVINFDHMANDQRFRLFRGKVNTGFSASSEVITGNFSGGSPTYRHIDCVAYTPDSGKVFATEPVQQNDQDTYAAASNPTSTDGFSCSMTTTGSNSFIWVAVLAVEDDTSNSVNDASAGTTATLRGTKHSMLDGTGSNLFPCLWEDKAQASSGAGTITATFAQSCRYMSTLAAVALEMQAIAITDDHDTAAWDPLSMEPLPAAFGVTKVVRGRR